MPSITVQAADSATAMDEIWEKLGPDAMIISTSKRNGRIVMEATTDSAKPAMALSVEAGFSDIFKGQMLAKPAVTEKAIAARKMPASTPETADIAGLRRDITQIQNMLSGLVLTDLDGVNPSLSASTRLLNVPICTLSLETPVTDFKKMTDDDTMLIDVTAMPDEANQKIAEIKTHVGAKEIGIITTIPGSTSRAMIELTMQRFADLAPVIALTKLDECETTANEFSAYIEQGARISILSGTKSVIGASIFASENILLQYLKENFSNHEAIMSTDTGIG